MAEVPSKYQPIICPQCGSQGMPDKNWTCKCGKYKHTVEPLEKEVSRDNRIASDWLLWVDEREVDMLNHRQDILHAAPGGIDAGKITVVGKGQRAGVGHWQVPYISSHPASDSTGSRGTTLADLQNCEQWIALIREVEQRLPQKMQIVLMLRRECRHNVGKRGWLSYVQYNYLGWARKNKKTEDMTISPDTIKAWWQKIISWTAIRAAKNGLL